MKKVKNNNLEELVKLYSSLNNDYIQLKSYDIGFSSDIATEQEKRLNLVWKVLSDILETNLNKT